MQSTVPVAAPTNTFGRRRRRRPRAAAGRASRPRRRSRSRARACSRPGPGRPGPGRRLGPDRFPCAADRKPASGAVDGAIGRRRGTMGGMTTPPGPRSVKISEDERGAWTSDRPRGNRPPRPRDISVRSRILRPADRLRYSPGSLLVIVSASAAERDRFAQRVIEDKGAIFSLDKVRALLAGRVPEGEVEDRARQLLDAAIAKRLQAGESVVLLAEGVQPEGREVMVRMAAAAERPRHLVLLEIPRDQVSEDDRATLNELRRALDAGELGQEGFQTVLRLGGAAVEELKRIVFRPPPRED